MKVKIHLDFYDLLDDHGMGKQLRAYLDDQKIELCPLPSGELLLGFHEENENLNTRFGGNYFWSVDIAKLVRRRAKDDPYDNEQLIQALEKMLKFAKRKR